MSSLDTIGQLAEETRHWASKNYSRFNSDPRLSCMCAIATHHLFNKFKENGIDCQIALRNVTDDGHCFLVTDTHIIDVTATQFDPKLAPVCIVNRKLKKPYYWRATRFFSDVKAWIDHLGRTKWPAEQLPLEFRQGYQK